jgi:Tfp pilus assembly protein PilF
MSLEQVVTQKLPEMTAEECERLGDRYLAQGNMDMAFIHYQKALHADPKQVRFRYKVGYLFLERGMVKEAQAEFQEIVKSNPGYAADCFAFPPTNHGDPHDTRVLIVRGGAFGARF